MEKRFKTLMFQDEFVSFAYLNTGIYTSSIPYLLSNTATMEDLKEYGKRFPEEWLENLEKCELVDIEIHVSNSLYLDSIKDDNQ